ncbi:MAG: 2Fe-2S ferredoxin [Euryarchaeota archaeon]|nr:2Fe-2S ferredoxin [Euryarchaeota archaeon]
MVKDPKGREKPEYKRHVFICTHEREPSATRPCCSAKDSLEVMKAMKMAAKKEGLLDVRIQKSGCLDFCENGISCVVYPEGIWYSIKNQEKDIPKILGHLRTGIPNESCKMKFED